MTYQCTLTGSPHKMIDVAPIAGADLNQSIQFALGTMLDIYERDDLHRDEARRAFEFWTPDEIKGDLDTCGQCDIVLCGGYYCITIKKGA